MLKTIWSLPLIKKLQILIIINIYNYQETIDTI
jgi:hypothetical protein